MKQSEVLSRQNRVVYMLLIITAILGVVWAVWKHQRMANEAIGPVPAPAAVPSATR